jgi:hypothetical protein
MSKLAITTALTLLGCGKADSPGKPVETEVQELAGIRFAAPKGSTYTADDPSAKVISGSRYRVEIAKQSFKVPLASFKESVDSEPGASKVTGTTTDRGWELQYTSTVTAGAASRRVYIRYVALGEGEQYECKYDDEDSPDVPAADAICKSIAKK